MTTPIFSPYSHLFMTTSVLPPMPSPLTYVVAGNGLHLWARRAGLEVLIPLAPHPIQGLEPVEPFVRFDASPRVSVQLVERMLMLGAYAQDEDGTPVETLFFLTPHDGDWHLTVPLQIQSPTSVRPRAEVLDQEAYNRVLIEVHTHPKMPAFFSQTDDREERGFRIYAVLGDPCLDTASGKATAQIRMRVVVYNPIAASYEFPASWVMEVPDGITECPWHA